MNKSNYTYHFVGDVLVINDQKGAKSVTNDIEHVLAAIHFIESKDLTGAKIIYNDSYDTYDGVIAKNTGEPGNPYYSVSFFHIGLKNEQQAINFINEYYERSTNPNNRTGS